MSTTLRAISAAVAVAGLAGAAGGQLRPVAGGRALDANFQVGSGGWNTTVRSPLGVSSQLYVDGQVTGLGNFRGTVGYNAPNQLHMTVPSAALSDFERRSVGISEVMGGAGYEALPYYSRSTTVLGLDGIRSGLAAPGSNVPRQSALTPNLARKLYVDALVDYRQVTPQSPGQTLTVAQPSPLAPPAADRTSDGAVRPGEERPAGARAEPASKVPGSSWSIGPDARVVPVRPGSGALFGVLRAENRQSLAQELYEIGAADGSDGPADLRVDLAMRPVSPAGGEARPGTVPPPDAGSGVSVARAGAQPQSLVTANQDVFIDLLMGLRELRETRQAAEKSATTKPSAEEPAVAKADYLAGPAPVDVRAGLPGTTTRPAPSGDAKKDAEAERVRKIVERLGTEKIVLHSLAGLRNDQFNFYMAVAERELKAGRYEQAAINYEYAIISDSANPLARVTLARVGLSLTLVAVGEPLRAAVNLRRAMELFPPLMMDTRIEVEGIMDASVLERQMILVDKRLDAAVAKVDPLLAFLAVYVHYNANEMVEARRYAQRLLAAAPEDKLYKAYADFVLTGKRPGAGKSATPKAGT